MNWNVLCAVLTWGLTFTAGFSAVVLGMNEAMESGNRPVSKRNVTVAVVLIPVALLGAAIIGGMGWGG